MTTGPTLHGNLSYISSSMKLQTGSENLNSNCGFTFGLLCELKLGII